jgi:YD repeat-containing protein
MTSLTDSEENTTTWSFDPLGRVATETINVSSTDLVRYFVYDARGNVTRKIDRNGRVIDYAFDALSRQMAETCHWGQSAVSGWLLRRQVPVDTIPPGQTFTDREL